MIYRKIGKEEIRKALPMIYETYLLYEGFNYSAEDIKAFYDAIHDEKYLDILEAYGAIDNDEIIGIIALRNNNHIALFFVKEEYQKQGIGSKLFKMIDIDHLTVNSSRYAFDIYKRLGFKAIDTEKEEKGIHYIPMEYRR